MAYEFRAGGEVFDNGFDIIRVRLIAPTGHTLEDTVQDGLVLFWSSENIGYMNSIYHQSVDRAIFVNFP